MVTDFQLFVGLFGTFLALLGVAIAVLQTVRYKQLEDTLKQIKRAKKAAIWTNIGIIVKVFDSLEDARHLMLNRDKVDYEILSKIASARRGTVDQYRELLEEAILEEPIFNMETIEKWENTNRLENEWRVNQAKRYIETENIQNGSEIE
jgi:hypothetical protein